MKHLSKKELIFFYYKDFSQRKLKLIQYHLQVCSSCRKVLTELKEMLADFKFSQLSLAKEELDTILIKVKAEANQPQKDSLLTLAKNYFSNFFKGLVLFFLNPKAVAMVISIFLIVFVIYFYNNEANQFSLQISEVEFDLVADDEFDIFLDSYQLQSQSYISSSRIISS